MSRTREIEFWVEPDDIERLTNKYDSSSVLRLYVHKDSVSPNGQMIKLIQTLPERKVTISESEFYEKTCDFFRVLSGPNSDIQIAKKWQEMFFKDAE